MAKKSGDAPESVSKWKKLKEHADRIVDTTEHHLRKGYDKAVDEHLFEKGRVDYEKLTKADIKKKFAKTMSDFYLGKAKEYFDIKGDLDEFQTDTLLTAYADTTQHELKKMVHQHGKDFTYAAFKKSKDKFLDELSHRMHAVAAEHIEDKDIEDIIKYTKSEDLVNHEYVKREDALGLLATFEESGVVPPKKYVELVRAAGKEYLLADKHKEKHKKAA